MGPREEHLPRPPGTGSQAQAALSTAGTSEDSGWPSPRKRDSKTQALPGALAALQA